MTALDRSKAAAAVLGVVALVGGGIGYVKAGSTASLIAGGVSGALLLVSAWLIARKPLGGLILADLVSVALLGRFGPAAIQSPAPVSVVMALGSLAVIALCSAALVGLRRSPSPRV